MLAVAFAVVDGLSGPVDSAAALNGKRPGFLGSPFGGGGLWGSSSSGGSPASSSASCPSGYSFTSDNLACEKVESRSASLSCPSGSSQFSLGIGAAWGCKRDLGAASTSYSCSQGVLAWRTVGAGFARTCKITSTSTESKAASASCSPRGSPTSCRYTNQVLTRQSQGASASCSPSGAPTSCRYTAQVSSRQSQGASASCSPRGAPSSCRYVLSSTFRQSQSASRYCSPRGTPASCRYSVRQSSSASYRYLPGIGGYYYCSSGWTLSGSTCYRYVNRYGTLYYSCPSGWSRSGSTCSRYVTSRTVRYGTLNYSCPSGWTRSGSTCYRYVRSSVTRYGTLSYSCPSGWSRSGGTCYRFVSTTLTHYGTLSYSCPSGWSRSGSTCTRTTTSVRYVSPTSSRSCSTGTLVSGRCWSYPAKVKSCPSGWTLSGNSCTRTLTAAPTYTYSCPQGKTLRGSRCYTPTTTATTTTTAATTTTTTTAATTTTTTTAATTTSTSGGSGVSPQVRTTTTTAALVACVAGQFPAVGARACATSPGPPQRVAAFPASGSLKVYWQGTPAGGQRRHAGGGASDLVLAHYTVAWREEGAATWTTVSPNVPATTTTTTTTAAGGATTTTIGPTGGFYTQVITGLKDKTVYEVRVSAVNNASYSAHSAPVKAKPQTRGDGGWQPYGLPNSETAHLNAKTQRGEALSICTTVRDFVAPITAAVNHWNSTLNPSGSAFQDVFTFSGRVSSLSDCRELAHGRKEAKIDPNNSFDIVISDYRCAAGSTDSRGRACPANAQVCTSVGCATARPITRCTAANRDTNLACAGSTTRCPALLAGCVWPNFEHWTDWSQLWAPRPVDGSAIQIVIVQERLFEHELGHLLGLDDYGYECAWHKEVPEAGEGQQPRKREYKVPSLYSYKDGPRSWQVLVDDPSKYKSDYFNCRSTTVTDRDKRDLSAIYYQRAFEGNRYSMFQAKIANQIKQFWQFQIAVPPSDPSPSTLLPRAPHVCDAEWGKENEGWAHVYNAYAWVIMHRAKGSTGPWKALRKDTAGTTRLDDGKLVSFKPSDLLKPKGRDLSQPPREVLELINPMENSLDGAGTGVSTTPANRPNDCVHMAVNVDLTEAAYANIRSHEFVVVGLTRGDPLVSESNLDGTSRSNILLDLGDGAKYWTLGEPSAVMTYPGSS